MKFKICAVVAVFGLASYFFIQKNIEKNKSLDSINSAVTLEQTSSVRKEKPNINSNDKLEAIANENLKNLVSNDVSGVRYKIVEGMRGGDLSSSDAFVIANQIASQTDRVYLMTQIALVLGQKQSFDEFLLMLKDIPPGNNRMQILTAFCNEISGRMTLESALTMIDSFSSSGFDEDMNIVLETVTASAGSLKYVEIGELMKNQFIAENDHFKIQMNRAYVNSCAAQFEDMQEALKHARSNTSMSEGELAATFFDCVLSNSKADPYALYDESWVSQDDRNAIIDFVARNNLRDQPEKALAWLSDNFNDVDSNGVYSSIAQWVADDTKLASELIVKIESSTLKKISCMALVRELRNTGSEAEAKAWEQYLGEVVDKLPDFPTAVEVKSR